MNVSLRPSAERDLDFVLAAEADADVRPWILPWSRAGHRATLDAEGMAHLIAVDEDRGRPVGFVILAGLEDETHHCIEFRRLVVTERGRGYGRATITTVCDLAFDSLGAHRLWLDVKQGNSRARHLYASVGFVQEGLLRECLAAEAGWESLVIMAMLEAEYRARR